METLLSLLAFANLVLLVIGFFSPSTSLFWYKNAKTRGKSTLIYGISFIIFCAIFGAITDKKSKGQAASMHSSNDGISARQSSVGAETQTQTTNTIKYAKIGDEIKVGHFAYVVNNVKFTKSIGSEPYGKQTADGEYVVIDLTIQNLDREAHTLDDSFYKLTDEQGIEYSSGDAGVQTAMMMEGKETLFLKEFNPNIKKKGYLVFEVPKQDIYDLHLSGGFWTGKTYSVRLAVRASD